MTTLAIATCFKRNKPWTREMFDKDVIPATMLPTYGLLQVTAPDRFRAR